MALTSMSAAPPNGLAAWAMSFRIPDDQLFLESVRKEFEFGPRQIGMSDQGIAHRVDSIAELVGLTKSSTCTHST